MIVEVIIGASVFIGAEYLRSEKGDKETLARLFRKSGLVVKYNKKEETPKLLRSSKKIDHTEYVYRIPEGLSFLDFEKKKEVIETGLNSSDRPVMLSDLRGFDIRGDYKEQVRSIKRSKNAFRELYMEYDKVLKIKIYENPLPKMLEYENNAKDWLVPIGVSRTKFLYHDFEKIKHMLVAGTTRYGKSVFLKNVIMTLIENKPKDVIFTTIDLKGGLTFARFGDCPQMSATASDVEESYTVLSAIDDQMNGVMAFLKENRFENVAEAGIKKRHFVIVDEGAELSPKTEGQKELKALKYKCDQILSRISRIGGALGYSLIYATQVPYSEVLNHNIKQNCDARLSFRLPSDKASEVILGEGMTDAHDLPLVKGRAVYVTDRKEIVQTPFIENDYIERVISDEN